MNKEEVSGYKMKYPKVFDLLSGVDESTEAEIAKFLADLDEKPREDVYIALISAVLTANFTISLSKIALEDVFGANAKKPKDPGDGTPTA